MTDNKNEKDVLKVIKTVPGNHARGHFNQREMDTIVREALPEYANKGDIGIITPYRSQALAINQVLGQEIASTVHKFQGRECDTIIMSMVDNAPTEFSDDANLLNVAISRAKKHLCIVTTGNKIPENSNLAQLIAYIQYNNFEIKESQLHSVFDLLYKAYTAERLSYEASHHKVSDYLSENLIYNTLKKAINELNLKNIDILCHYPLSKLIIDYNKFDPQELAFAQSPYSHVDFLLYNSLTKSPFFTIEVDGWKYHKDSTVQKSRDTLKDKILSKIGLKHQRISTIEIVNVETIKKLFKAH